MKQTVYGLTQSGNRYYYGMGNQALAVQLTPRPMAWRKTPSTTWQRTHGNVLRLDMLGFGILELDPLAEYDRSSTMVYGLVPSNGRFEYEPDWSDSIPFPVWEKDNSWREIVSGLMSEIEPGVLEKLREFSHYHWRLIEALDGWPGFFDLLDKNPALAVCLAGRIRVGAQERAKRPRLNYKKLVQRSEKEIGAALGFGDSDEVVEIMRKVVPDACKPHDLAILPDLMRNPITRKALLETDVITRPALLFLRNPCLSRYLAGSFLSDVGKLFPHTFDILACPWGPLLRGGSKEELFTLIYQQALEVVECAEDPTIDSIRNLGRKHSELFGPPSFLLPNFS